jgi:CheY-like chemotaxis protein
MPSAGAKCVLVVDDDALIRRTVGEILELGGYRVELAAHGKQALALVNATRPDAIVLDLMMPIMDGGAFMEYHRADPVARHTPVLILSARGNLDGLASELGAQAVLAKPFDLQEFLDTVERLLKHADVFEC